MTNNVLESTDMSPAPRIGRRARSGASAALAARADPPARKASLPAFLAFFALAFALSWWPWPLMLLNPASVPLLPWGPLVAAFLMAAVADGRRGPRDLLRSLVRWRVEGRWYAVAVALPVAVTIATAAMNILLGAAGPQAVDFADWYTFPLVLLVTLVLKGPLTEEVAWRGFALPRLLDRLPPVVASLLLGGIWAFWHLPLLVSDGSGQRPPLQFVVGLGAMSILFTWVYVRTRGSLLLATLMHAMFNTVAAFVFPAFQGDGYERLWWIYAGVLWAVALAVLVLGRGLRAQASGAAPQSASQG